MLESPKKLLAIAPHPEDETDIFEAKVAALRCYESQITPFPGPRSGEAVRALAAFRGTQAGFAYGEGLHIVRVVS